MLNFIHSTKSNIAILTLLINLIKEKEKAYILNCLQIASLL